MPINTYFILYFAKNKIRLNLGKSKETMKNQYEVEWFLRSKLSAKGDFDATDILKKFSGSLEIEGFYSDKLFTVWEAYYCIDVLSDERLARIKLNKAVSMRSTLEGDFQVWKCKILLEEHSIGFYEDISTLYYILQLENIKKKDEILCNKFLDFWAEITSDKPMMAKLQHFSGEISRKLDEVKKGYSDLVKSFPNNIYCHELYGSLLMDILKNNEIGFKLLSRKNGLMSIQKEASKSKFWKFSEINGFLIVSANPELFGTIIYANLPAGQILSQPVSRIIGSKLSSYIPEPFSEQHDKYLKKFLSNCTNPDVEPKMSYFLKNERGYLVGCDFKITLISLVEHIYFFISLNPNVKHREFALVSDYGQIYAYSELFPQIIGNNKISLANQFADKIIPGVECLAMKPLEPLLISINSKEILLVKITHIVLKSSFTFLVLIDDYSEIEAWKRGEDTIQKRENKYKNENNLTNDVKKNKSLSRSPKNHHRLSAFYSVAEIGYTIENEKNKEQENIKTPFTAAESTLAYNAGLGN
ncbi:unnamed protein product [Blepharisma stoltei]|uniref:TmcB/TmcC TPR repeats domain-containing protein n=1 Tax=Blepharisma stoltei TaxID=1481888 RepID=A0AAU9JRB0_9CILI|nr:unnamed protein product [Blepharisma stoltei]